MLKLDTRDDTRRAPIRGAAQRGVPRDGRGTIKKQTKNEREMGGGEGNG